MGLHGVGGTVVVVADFGVVEVGDAFFGVTGTGVGVVESEVTHFGGKGVQV